MVFSKEEVAYEIKIHWNELTPKITDTLSPYDKFYFHAIRGTLLDDETLKLLYSEGNETLYELYNKYMENFEVSVSDFCISKKDFKKLERLEIKYWAKKKGFTQKYIKAFYIMMHNLNFSPAEFRPRKPRWAKHGYIYMRELKGKE